MTTELRWRGRLAGSADASAVTAELSQLSFLPFAASGTELIAVLPLGHVVFDHAVSLAMRQAAALGGPWVVEGPSDDTFLGRCESTVVDGVEVLEFVLTTVAVAEVPAALGVADVHTRADLVRFIRALRAELLTRGDDWENPWLDDYLEALSAWTDDIDAITTIGDEPVPDEPTWQLVAQMLRAATAYE